MRQAEYPTLLAKNLKCRPLHTEYPETHGGNQPAKLLDEAARRISMGENKVAVVTGAEALASCMWSLSMRARTRATG